MVRFEYAKVASSEILQIASLAGLECDMLLYVPRVAKHRPRSADLRFTLVVPDTSLWPSLLHVGTNQARLTRSG